MKKKQFILFAAMTVVAFISPSVHAVGLLFLDQTPITFLKKKDKAALHNAALSVLDNKKDGEVTNWSNDGLGNSVHIQAEVTASDTVNTNEKLCRHLHVVLHAKGQDQSLKLPICKQSGSTWKIEKQ